MNQLIESKKAELIAICERLSVQSMYVFGSAVSGDFNEESDIDFLISFPTDFPVVSYTDNYFSLHYQLRDLFGREIDIVTERSLSNPFFIQMVQATKELIYEA